MSAAIRRLPTTDAAMTEPLRAPVIYGVETALARKLPVKGAPAGLAIRRRCFPAREAENDLALAPEARRLRRHRPLGSWMGTTVQRLMWPCLHIKATNTISHLCFGVSVFVH